MVLSQSFRYHLLSHPRTNFLGPANWKFIIYGRNLELQSKFNGD